MAMPLYFDDSSIGEILQEDKENKWGMKKRGTEMLSECFEELGMYGRAERTSQCTTWLKFSECGEGHRKLTDARFCRDRLCPMCSWRRSRKMSGQILEVLHTAQKEYPSLRHVFLTLTVRNCRSEELEKTLNFMFEGFKWLVGPKSPAYKNIWGWVRNLEITYNDKDDTYHPHIHVLLGVTPDYFSRSYITQAKWTALWQKAAKLDYKPRVDIRVVKDKKKTNEPDPVDDESPKATTMINAALETGKYTVKESDYLKSTVEESLPIVETLAYGLHSRRLLAYGKAYKRIKAALLLPDVEDENADLTDGTSGACTCPICNGQVVERLYSWNYGVRKYVAN